MDARQAETCNIRVPNQRSVFFRHVLNHLYWARVKFDVEDDCGGVSGAEGRKAKRRVVVSPKDSLLLTFGW